MSDIYYCAIDGSQFLADWSVRCECTKCMPLDAPDPLTRREEELVGDYEMAALVLKNMAKYCGFNVEPICADWDTPIGALGLMMAEGYLKQKQRNEQWATAFHAYSKALSEPYFDQDDESRQSNRAEVERCFDNLKALAEE